MKKLSSILLLLGITLACSDVVENDIADDSVTIISPAEGQTIIGNTVQFRWEELEDADTYQLLIENTDNFLVLDTVVSASKFSNVLESGAFKWKVRAQNSGYDSRYTAETNFSVTSNPDISEEVIQITAPDAGEFTKDANAFTFKWKKVEEATSYEVEVSKIENGPNTVLYTETDLSTNSFKIPVGEINEDGAYIFQIIALNVNNDTNTEEFNITFNVDTMAPPKAVLTAPLESGTVTRDSAVSLEWTLTDTGVAQAPLTSELEIDTTRSFNSADLIKQSVGVDNTYTFTPTKTGTFYWRISTQDQLGNSPEAISEIRSFIVQ